MSKKQWVAVYVGLALGAPAVGVVLAREFSAPAIGFVSGWTIFFFALGHRAYRLVRKMGEQVTGGRLASLACVSLIGALLVSFMNFGLAEQLRGNSLATYDGLSMIGGALMLISLGLFVAAGVCGIMRIREKPGRLVEPTAAGDTEVSSRGF
jgi:hypothetical protein